MFKENIWFNNNKSKIIYKKNVYDYNFLENEINKIIYYFIANKINTNVPIIIFLDRSPNVVITILAVLIYGGTFITVDPKLPKERIEYILSNSDSNIIITENKYIEKEAILFKNINIINLDDIKEIKDINFEYNVNMTDENKVAYIMYTSGSTGKPKGVKISRLSLLNFIEGVSEIIDFNEGDIIASFTSISFDIFFLESILAISKGLTIILSSEEERTNPKLISMLIENNHVDIVQMTPSSMQLLLNYDNTLNYLKGIKKILIGGEPFIENHLKILQEKTKAKIFNMYGPTETTIWSTISELTNKIQINIGKPIKNTKVYILDDNLNILESGEAGEICISGEGLSIGYHKNDKLTNRKFTILPCTGERIYKTGDLGRYLIDGNLEFLGRIDNQVKIRGYRVELEDIEANINSFDYINQSVVLLKENTNNKILYAYYTSDYSIDEQDIKNFLKLKLPEYMIPAKFIRITNFEYTSTGKIDRRKMYDLLNTIDNVQKINNSNINKSENCKKVLEILNISNDYDLKDLNIRLDTVGIDSITFIKIIVEIENKFDINFDDDMLVVDKFTDIASLVNYVEKKCNKHG